MWEECKSFQEFVNAYYGWEIDLCELTEEDAVELEKLYEEEKSCCTTK